MAKPRIVYVCQQCGASSAKWRGNCPSCNEWNTYVEEVVEKKSSPAGRPGVKAKAVPLDSFSLTTIDRIEMKDPELNRVLGGGLVPGSLVLLGGEPGIGKSTLLLQLALEQRDKKILYVSGEESLNQVKLRASRIGDPNPNCYLLPETNLESILVQVAEIEPDIVIIDSIQTLTTAELDATAGSVPQIRECTAKLQSLSKKDGPAIFLVGHITKEGYIAGPKILEHMVDAVLYFEGDRNYNYRILRTIKNRFGSVADIGIYEMQQKGLIPVINPSEILLTQHDQRLSGISIAAMLEGIRPMMIEIQALVSPSYYGNPQRTTTGFDGRRMNMLLAVLEKRCGLKVNSTDVFLNIAGGIKVEDPGIDLAVVAAISSSYHDLSLPENCCFAGEVGLSGEIRPIQQIEKRISEAEKLGFDAIYVSAFHKAPVLKHSKKLKIKTADTVFNLLKDFY